MFKVVLFSLLIAAFAIVNANPVGKSEELPAVKARRIVNQTNWASVATESMINLVKWPMVNLMPTANVENTGEIYLFTMPIDMVAIDTKDDNRITLMFTDAQEGICQQNSIDPWDHKCGKIMISGRIQKVEKDTEDYNRGIEEFRRRHPNAGYLPSLDPTASVTSAAQRARFTHNFYLCKLEISNVIVFTARGYKHLSPEEYAAANNVVEA